MKGSADSQSSLINVDVKVGSTSFAADTACEASAYDTSSDVVFVEDTCELTGRYFHIGGVTSSGNFDVVVMSMAIFPTEVDCSHFTWDAPSDTTLTVSWDGDAGTITINEDPTAPAIFGAGAKTLTQCMKMPFVIKEQNTVSGELSALSGILSYSAGTITVTPTQLSDVGTYTIYTKREFAADPNEADIQTITINVVDCDGDTTITPPTNPD